MNLATTKAPAYLTIARAVEQERETLRLVLLRLGVAPSELTPARNLAHLMWKEQVELALREKGGGHFAADIVVEPNGGDEFFARIPVLSLGDIYMALP